MKLHLVWWTGASPMDPTGGLTAPPRPPAGLISPPPEIPGSATVCAPPEIFQARRH